MEASRLFVIEFSIELILCSIADILESKEESVTLLVPDYAVLIAIIFETLALLMLTGVDGFPNVDTESVSAPVITRFRRAKAASSADSLCNGVLFVFTLLLFNVSLFSSFLEDCVCVTVKL